MLAIKTMADIRKLEPCYDPSEYLPEDWQGTVLDILRFDACPEQDRLWVVLNDDWLDESTLRLFTKWCETWTGREFSSPRITASEMAGAIARGHAIYIANDALGESAREDAWPEWYAKYCAEWKKARALARNIQVEKLIELIEEAIT